MTSPDEAKERAENALANAKTIRDKGVNIAARWRKSQEDNNFRQMLRTIGKGITPDAS